MQLIDEIIAPPAPSILLRIKIVRMNRDTSDALKWALIADGENVGGLEMGDPGSRFDWTTGSLPLKSNV